MAVSISALVHSSFNQLAAEDWGQHARDFFRQQSSPAILADS